jgi:hypothetical protein
MNGGAEAVQVVSGWMNGWVMEQIGG